MKQLTMHGKQVVSFIFLILVISACFTPSTVMPTIGDEGRIEADTYNLIYHSSYTPKDESDDFDPLYHVQERFMDLVEKRTDGRVTFDVYYNNQLVGQDESVDALANGTIDIQMTSPDYWAERIPEGFIVNLPYWNMGAEHSLHILQETKVGMLYEQALEEYDIKLLNYWISGTSGYMSTSPISDVEAMQGSIINTTSNFAINFNEEVGAGTASLSVAEQYEGLYRGTIDTIQFPYYSLESIRYVDVIDYLSVPTFNPSVGMVAMSQSTWNELPEDIQDIMMETAQEMEETTAEVGPSYDQEIFEFAEDHGVELINMSEGDFEEMEQLAQETVWEDFASVNDRTEQMVESLLMENEKWLEENPEAENYMDQYLD
ncbi:TRAP transporter substrate-binding protein DctP [Salicibibacter cibarius]|uniref:TRAP transporter substrate-binding protein DctP n=1 Tax=Salicibibacter cibarius TaxID=2743000 RepID=A0A7T7CBY4_9BACI|nr:TRAP transporter substrate-binding protein DctP [Salicibibacter cibarius]QQK76439.1 TRAP transporter substrate-binding protein DctP [Salicibibacter cibarius]